jgi:hypothetical protein
MIHRFVLLRLRRALLGAAIATIILNSGVGNARAQSNWNGGSGNWNVNSNWTPIGVPNNPSTDVIIAGTSGNLSVVTLDNLSPSVHNLSLDSFSTLSIQGQTLSVFGSSISNAGQVNLGVSGNPATLNFAASTVTLSGGGTVSLNDPGSAIRGNLGTETLINQDNTIQGQGTIAILASFQNGGTVNATTGTLAISTNSLTNSGIIEATGGTLNLDVPTITNTGTIRAFGGPLNINLATVNNAGGTITSNGSSPVTLFAAEIIGGNLTSLNGGVIQGSGGTGLNGVTITSGSVYTILGGNTNFLDGDLINHGLVNISLAGAGASSLIVTPSTATLSGGGTVSLNDPGSVIQGAVGTETLINHDNTIQGQGTITNLASFQNGGTVNANVSGGTLAISATSTNNTGTFRADGGQLSTSPAPL